MNAKSMATKRAPKEHRVETLEGRHRPVLVTVGSTSAMIDAKIAPLVQSLWEAGIATAESCEDDRGDGWPAIYFDRSDDLSKFVTLAARHASAALRRRMTGDPSPPRNAWDYGIFPHADVESVPFPCVARFPRSDVAPLLRSFDALFASWDEMRAQAGRKPTKV